MIRFTYKVLGVEISIAAKSFPDMGVYQDELIALAQQVALGSRPEIEQLRVEVYGEEEDA